MAFAIGQTLQQRYQIQGILGQGGMGVVYQAYDPVLQRTVAIKVLPAQLTIDAEFVARFQREAIASANLRHPHIVTVHDVGQQDGEYFIIMEHLAGNTLEQWLAQHGPMPVAQASQVLEQIASALDYAHSRSIVHRDVKPSNIMLDAQGRAVLMDFGLVRARRRIRPHPQHHGDGHPGIHGA
jgi:serine/threonine protein kinase